MNATPNKYEPTAPPTGPNSASTFCLGNFSYHFNNPSNSPPEPFIEAPTACGEAAQSGIDVLAYDGTEAHADAPFPEVTGCDVLSFNPSLAARPSTGATDSPSGLDVDLTVPQYESPNGPLALGDPRHRNGPARGLLDQLQRRRRQDLLHRRGSELRYREEAHCPEFSKIGTLNIDSSALPGPLPGLPLPRRTHCPATATASS